MKATTLLTAFIVILSFSASAQKHGIRAGYQAAGQFESGSQQYGTLNNFYAGVFRNDDIVPFLDWHKGVEYIQAGFYSDENNFRRIHTISVPMALRAKVGPVFALAGVAGNFKVAERFELGGTDVLDDDTKASFFDLPVIAGVGVKFAIVTIEARYAHGLLEVNNDLNNAYFQLGVGLSLF